MRILLAFLFSGICIKAETETAALIVGGYKAAQGSLSSGYKRNEVELFGCRLPDGNPAQSIPMTSYPGGGVWIPAGKWLPETEEVLICGGYHCKDPDSPFCSVSDECFTWSPDASGGVWTQAEPLKEPRWGHMLTLMENGNPVVLGQHEMSEIRDENGIWQDYKTLPRESWFSTQCLIDYNDFIYHNNWNSTERVDKSGNPGGNSFFVEELSLNPFNIKRPGRCAGVDINGEKGIMTRIGYWYQLTGKETNTWRVAPAPPGNPYDSDVIAENNMFSFNGNPTIFGNHLCQNSECQSTNVIQFDPTSLEWIKIGELLLERGLHEVIEVPISVCDNFILKPQEEAHSSASVATLTSLFFLILPSVTQTFL